MAKIQKKLSLLKKFLILTFIFFSLSSKSVRAEDYVGNITTWIDSDGGFVTSETMSFDDGSTLTSRTHDSGALTYGFTTADDPDARKIICAELHQQGLLSHRIFAADQKFGVKLQQENPVAYFGYITWAGFIVRKMRASKGFTRLISFIAQPWAKHMAYKMGATTENSYAGVVLMSLGLIFCNVVGRVKLTSLYYKRHLAS